VTPWSPLRGGVLTGKYTRDNVKEAKPGRGERVTAFLNERSFAIIDELIRIAAKHAVTPAAVALAWLLRKPGVDSVIIGARSVEQLEQNLAAFDVVLGADDMTALDQVSAPTLGFPHMFLANANMIMHGGTTVNGEPAPVWPMAPATDADRY
jgi:aryl-alcohol dehydrogenase-like predicted oxidoreductase